VHELVTNAVAAGEDRHLQSIQRQASPQVARDLPADFTTMYTKIAGNSLSLPPARPAGLPARSGAWPPPGCRGVRIR
jgi:hypothetical protein